MGDVAQEEAVHTHDCSRCAYVWQCRMSGRRHPEDDICAICEALDRMQRGTPTSESSRPAVEGDSGETSDDRALPYYGERA